MPAAPPGGPRAARASLMSPNSFSSLIFAETPLAPQVVTVMEAIETDIIRARILPRMRLIEDHLMEDYAAKRHVVRAALVELQRLGVVVKPPHLGAQIRRFDQRGLDDLYHMRRVLHHTAIEMMEFPVPPERLAAVEAACQAHARAAASGELIAIHRSNMVFHREFYGLCDNIYLAESIRLHDWLSFPVRAYGVADAGALEQACREHRAMVDAVRAGNRAALEALSVAHMGRARGIYEEKFLTR